MNLAARAGRWSAAHWKTAFVAWICFAAVFYFLGNAVGSVKLADADTGSGETARAQSILKHANFTQKATEEVLVQSPALTVGSPAFRQAISDVEARLRTFPVIDLIRSPLDPSREGMVSVDRHSALVQFEMREVGQVARKHVQPILDAVAVEENAHPGFKIEEFGLASSQHVLNKTVGDDFRKAEQLTVPITLVILLFAFGALVAALLPVGLAFTGFLGALGFAAVVSHLQPSSDATSSVILLMGMAVGVDYSLFYLRREREERARGRSPRSALSVTAATSGQAVLISGLTVLIAMAGMLLAGNPVFTSIGIGTMIMISVAIVGSLTILPALLSKLEDRVDRGRVPYRLAVRPRRRRVALLGRGRLGRDAAPARLAPAGRGRAARDRPPGDRHAHPAPELHRPAPEPAGDQGLRGHPGGVPGRSDTGRDRRQGAERARAEGRRRRGGAGQAGARDAGHEAARLRDSRARTEPSPGSTSRSSATAPTRARTAPSSCCAGS